MAVLAAILPVVARSSALALELYRVAAEPPETAKEFIGVASQINGFGAILKQVGTIIKEDDRLPSPEVRSMLYKERCVYMEEQGIGKFWKDRDAFFSFVLG